MIGSDTNDDMPEGWASVSISGASEPLISGFACGEKEVPNGLRHLRMNNITDECALNLSLVRTVPTHLKGERYLLRRGDVICCTTNSGKLVGKVCLFDQEGDWAFSNHLTRIRPKPGVIEAKWLYYGLAQLWRAGAYEELTRNWVNQSTLPKESLANCVLPLPPLEEQKRIVSQVEALLARVNAARERLEKVPAILKRFRQSVLAAAVCGNLTAEWREAHSDIDSVAELLHSLNATPVGGDEATEHIGFEFRVPASWMWVRIGDVVDILNGRAFPSKEYCDSGVRLLRPGNLHISGRVEWNDDNTVCLPSKWAHAYPEYLLKTGDLLMNLTAQSLKDEFLGRVCILSDTAPALLNQRIARIASKGQRDLRPYLFLYLKSPLFRSFVNTLDTGSLIRHMHSKQVMGHVVPLPPFAEQIEIARRVGSLFRRADQIESRASLALKLAEKVPQAILAKAFRGELVSTEAELAQREGRDFEPASALLARIIGQQKPAESKTLSRKRMVLSRRVSKGLR